MDHDAGHKVDGIVPALIAAGPVSVTSAAGTDSTYAIGDAIDITATFKEPVTVTPAGDPVAGPRIAFTLGAATKHAVYHSGSGSSALVFRYTVAEDDADTDGISVVENGLALNGGAIADAVGYAAAAAQLEHPALAAQGSHKVDGVRPTVSHAVVAGTTLTVIFNENLAAAASLANGAFEVKKTPSGGSETTVALSGSPSLSGAKVTLTLASAVLDSDTGVKVSYARPAQGTGNKLVDTAGNEVASFANRSVDGSRPGAPAKPAVTGASPSSVQVSWTAPDMTGKPRITDYDVLWFKGSADPDDDSQWTVHPHVGTATRTTIIGLDPGSAYRVQVRAENAHGEGPWSPSGQGRTQSAAVPSSCGSISNPANWIASVTSTASSITVTLNAPPASGSIRLQVCAPKPSNPNLYEKYQVKSVRTPTAGSHTFEDFQVQASAGGRT